MSERTTITYSIKNLQNNCKDCGKKAIIHVSGKGFLCENHFNVEQFFKRKTK